MVITPQHLADLLPQDFQRLAVDALRAHAAPRHGVRVVDLGYGVKDGGFDGVLEEEDGSAWRIEGKSTGDFATLRGEVREHLKKYADRPTLVLCRLALTQAQRNEILKLRSAPAVRVHDGAEICSWLRQHAWVARAFGLGGPAWFSPGDILRGRPEPRLAQSEAAAVERALALLATDPALLVVHGPPGARPNVVVEALAHRLNQADPAGRAVAVVDPSVLDEIGPLDVERLGLDQERLRLLSVAKDPQRRDWVITEQRLRSLLHRPGVALVVPARLARNLARAAFPSRVEELTLPVPSKAERRAFAQAAAGRQGLEIDAWSLWLEDLDHLDALVQPGALDRLVWERAGDTVGRELAAWVALLGAVPGQVVDLLGTLVGCPRPWEVLQRLEALHLLARSEDRWQPAGQALRGVLVRAWLWDDTFDRQRFQLQATRFESEQRTAILAGLWTAVSPGDADPASAEIEALLEVANEDEQRQMLRREPEAFAATPTAYRRALELAREGVLLGPIIRAVRWQGQLAREALQLVVELGAQTKEASTLARATVDTANGISSRAASEAMSWLQTQITSGLSPELGVPVASGVLEVRLAATIATQRNLPTGITLGFLLWDEASEAVSEAFRTAADLLIAMLRHQDRAWRDAGFECLGRAGRDIGFSTRPADAPIPEALARALRRALREAGAVVSSLRARPERIYREMALTSLLRHRWARDEDSARIVAASIARDPESRLLHRLTARFFDFPEPDRLVEGVEAAQVEARPNQTYTEDEEAIEAWLSTEPSSEQLRALLVDTVTIGSSSGRDFLRGGVLALLAERRRDLVWPLIAEEWDTLSEEVQQLLLVAAIRAFGEDLADAITGDKGDRPSGLAARMRRFFQEPLQFRGADAGRMVEVARWVLPDTMVPGLLVRLAGHPDRSVRGPLEWWLYDWVKRGRPDSEAIIAAVRPLVAPPHGLPQLAGISEQTHRAPEWQLEPGSPLEAVLLDALETHLPEISSPGDQLRWELRPLVARLFQARPAAVWHRPGAFFSTLGDAEMLELVDAVDALATLRVAPAEPWMQGRAAHLFDVLVARVEPSAWEAEVRSLLGAGRTAVAAQWFSARGLQAAWLGLLTEILEVLSEEWAEELIYELVVGRGHRLVFSGPHKLDLFEEPEPFQVPELVGQVRQHALSAPACAAHRLRRLATDLEVHARAAHGALLGVRPPTGMK